MSEAFADPGARILRARLAKAQALARLLLASEYTTAELALMGEQDWATVAGCANVRPPSEETIRLVFGLVMRGQKR